MFEFMEIFEKLRIENILVFQNDSRIEEYHQQIDLPTKYQFNYRQILLMLNLAYAIPSFYIYSKCRKLLKKNSNNHFNTIFSNDFYINVALFIIDIISTRLPISGLINNYPSFLPSGYFLTIIYFLSYYLIYANYFSITLICLNRMTSVVFPHVSSWTQKHRAKRIEIVMFAIALVACSSLVLQCIIQLTIMIFTKNEVIRDTAQGLRNFCLDLSICAPPWILYFSTNSHKQTGSLQSSTEVSKK
ncbi:unnamed protein product [Caenorhabditis angaria]|uniref:Serpentine receptor class gamma n=1 Tax=Caenorhabditis angaria TaxID=860376 RepID=A0A9P1IHZ6_9PELO|nr:unnamed protein product [Caenorhabditis angaria]